MGRGVHPPSVLEDEGCQATAFASSRRRKANLVSHELLATVMSANPEGMDSATVLNIAGIAHMGAVPNKGPVGGFHSL